jgi:uncharacterized membrane protein YfcA
MSIAVAYILYLIIGAAAGILGGLLGIGGGVITVPALLVMFHYLDFPQPYIMHMAIATSLAAMILNTAAATWAHNKRGAVLWPVFKKMVPGFVAGSILGALIAVWFSGVLLEIIFGLFLCALAFFFYRQKAIKIGTQKLPSMGKLSFYSCCIGATSNLMGIGGGTMVVPLLSSFKISDRNAIGTSAASTLITTLLGTISYLILGLSVIPSEEAIGFIDLPAFIIIGVVAFFLAPVGAKLTHEISQEKVRKIFAVVLVLTGLSLIFL